MVTLIKLGGSLITDKTKKAHFREDVMRRIVREIAEVYRVNPASQLLIGHGSGSYGHFEAKQHDTMSGVQSPEQWLGFSKVAFVASHLNFLVAQTFFDADLPIMRFQPSATVLAEDGIIQKMDTFTIQQALQAGLIPLTHGDVAFDSVRGGTIISTETVFTYLVHHLPVKKIILLGEVDGVYDADKVVIPQITPTNFEQVNAAIEGSSGVDVTGGMLTKVQDMLNLVQQFPQLQIIIANGQKLDILTDLLCHDKFRGTIIQIPS